MSRATVEPSRVRRSWWWDCYTCDRGTERSIAGRERPEEGARVTDAATHVSRGRVRLLVGAAHIGPSLAVTLVVLLLAITQYLPPFRAAAVTAAVLAGQLTIGWGNDLVDRDRDRQVV